MSAHFENMNDYWWNFTGDNSFVNYSTLTPDNFVTMNAMTPTYVAGTESYLNTYQTPAVSNEALINVQSERKAVLGISDDDGAKLQNELTENQQAFESENPVTDELPTYADATEGLEEGIDVGEEGLEIGAEVADPILLPVIAANQILQGIGSAITSSKVTAFNNDAYTTYNNAISTGHGVGFASIANQNLQNSLSASSQYAITSNLIGTIFGPAGAIFSSFVSPDSFNSTPITGFTAETISGNFVNAQNSQTINSDSYDNPTNENPS